MIPIGFGPTLMFFINTSRLGCAENIEKSVADSFTLPLNRTMG